ncbi:MAG: hypothetical protein KIS96_11990 [Bauldia sp.]|nr:hypothetical protein [Bauldia sp.]
MATGEADGTEAYRFRPEDLRVAERRPGISAFMRIRNGAEFLEPAIRSHISHFDEIVAVHNQCTDATPAILARLQGELGADRLRVFHYEPPVFPPGSREHAQEPATSPHSLVNYYNFALAKTRFQVVAKLDDDQIAMERPVAAITGRIRAGELPADALWCYGGINLSRDDSGRYGVPAIAPLVGLGDQWYFRVNEGTFFERDPRFERLRRPGMRRVFIGFAFWHLKYLKAESGFANYGIASGANARYQRKHDRFMADRSVIDLAAIPPPRSVFPFGEKARIKRAAATALRRSDVTQRDLDAMIAELEHDSRLQT